MKIQLKDIYWLAGLLEGEGAFGIAHGSQPRIQLRMTDRDVVARAAMLLGHLTVLSNAPRGATRQPMFGCAVTGRQAAAWMMTVYSLLGIRRQGQIRIALLAWRNTRRWQYRKVAPPRYDGKRVA